MGEKNEEKVLSFFTPKMTKEEMKLNELENEDHLNTYHGENPDVNVEEMEKLDSKSKYVLCTCVRETFQNLLPTVLV